MSFEYLQTDDKVMVHSWHPGSARGLRFPGTVVAVSKTRITVRWEQDGTIHREQFARGSGIKIGQAETSWPTQLKRMQEDKT